MTEDELKALVARLRRESLYRHEWHEPHGEITVTMFPDMKGEPGVFAKPINPDGASAAAAIEVLMAERDCVLDLQHDVENARHERNEAIARAERAEKERDNMQLVAETYEAKFREWADRAEKAEAALEIMRKLIKDVRRLSSIEYAPEESLMSILREQIDAVLAQIEKETGRE